MLTSYIQTAMHKATYELLEDDTFYGKIPGLRGVWGNAPTFEVYREDLQEQIQQTGPLQLL